MPLYISLMKLTAKGLAEIEGSSDRARISRERVEALGGRSLSFYATMGKYDFVQVFEMPDNAAMLHYLVIARRDGYVDPVVMPAFGADEWQRISQAASGKRVDDD